MPSTLAKVFWLAFMSDHMWVGAAKGLSHLGLLFRETGKEVAMFVMTSPVITDLVL